VTGSRDWKYVPFLLKLPAQHRAIEYKREFNNVISAELIWQILTGNLKKPEQAVSWLNAH
jgi:hypothetical protein